MDFIEKDDINPQFQHFLAENESLKAQLMDYKAVIDARDREIAGLLRDAAEANELRSEVENKLDELEFLQNYIGKLQQQAEGAMGREAETDLYIKESLSTEQQLAELKQQYTYLQTKLLDLQAQLQAVTDRNLILQQQLASMAELESLLAEAEEERDEWKRKATELLAQIKDA